MKKSGRTRKVSGDGASRSVGVLKWPIRQYVSIYRKRKKTTVLLTILLVGLLVYGSLILVEIAQFKRVERKTNALYATVLAEFPEAKDHGISKSCGYASAKFQKGDLGCGYGFGVRILEPDLAKANEIANRFDKLLKEQNEFNITSKSSGLIDLSKEDQYGISGEKTYTVNDGVKGIGCSGSTRYEKKDSSSVSIEYLRLTIYCGKSPSLIKHYPVTEE